MILINILKMNKIQIIKIKVIFFNLKYSKYIIL